MKDCGPQVEDLAVAFLFDDSGGRYRDALRAELRAAVAVLSSLDSGSDSESDDSAFQSLAGGNDS